MKFMSASKRIAALLLACVMLFPLASCGDESAATGEALILPIDSAGEGVGATRLVEVTTGRISRRYSMDASVSYASEELRCEFDDAYFAESFVSAGQQVSKGDPLFSFTIDYSRAELESLEAELEIAKSSAERREASSRAAVASAEKALAAADTGDARALRRAELNLERAELNLEAALLSAEKSVEAAETALAEFEARIAENTIYAPSDGLVLSIEFMQPGTQVPRGGRMCSFMSFEAFSLSAASDLTGAVRHGQAATVSANIGGGVTFESRILDAPMVRGEEIGSFSVELTPEIIELANTAISSGTEQYMRLMPSVRVEVTRFELDNVTMVPNDALQSENGNRFVYVMRDGELRKRFIVAGMADENNTQVLAGLEPGELVSIG